MEAIGRRERKKAATRQALSDAALRLFLERGYDRVTVAQIAVLTGLLRPDGGRRAGAVPARFGPVTLRSRRDRLGSETIVFVGYPGYLVDEAEVRPVDAAA